MDDVVSNKIDKIIADLRKHVETLDDYKKRKYTKDLDYLSDAIGYMLNYIWAEKDNMDELVDSIDAMGEEYGD
jgi:hypothetical protein